MKTTPSISVIITTYNSANCVSAAIDSIIAQEEVGFEIIVVDDCSDDFSNLVSLVASYASKVSITLKQPLEKGNANVSRNIGIANAQYPFVAFLDADDTWNPKHLISAIQTVESYSLDGCFSKVTLVSTATRTEALPVYEPDDDICDFIFHKNGIAVTSSLVIKKSTLLLVSFDNALYKHQDWDFLIRYTQRFRLGQSPYYGLNYTLTTGKNMSSTFNFEASITFMNNTLPLAWHNTFLTSQVSKIVNQKGYHELVTLERRIKREYTPAYTTLGLKNRVTLFSAKSRLLFFPFIASLKMIDLVKSVLRIFTRIR